MDLEVDARFGSISNAWSDSLSFLFDSPSSVRSPEKYRKVQDVKIDEEGASPESEVFKFEKNEEEEKKD